MTIPDPAVDAPAVIGVKPGRAAAVPRWVSAIVLASALLLGIGALTIVPPLSSQPAAYLANRNVGLAVLLLVLLAVRWNQSLGAVLLTTAGMHVIDAMADVHFKNWGAAVGSIVVAVMAALAARRLLRLEP